MNEELDKKIKNFVKYLFHLEEKCINSLPGKHYSCPCCNYPTLAERGAYHICVLCFWEDDGQDEPFCEEVWHGPNGNYSLSQARNNFSEYLTYCSPEDKEIFEMNKEKDHLKICLIQKYEALKNETSKEKIIKIECEIEKIKNQLY